MLQRCTLPGVTPETSDSIRRAEGQGRQCRYRQPRTDTAITYLSAILLSEGRWCFGDTGYCLFRGPEQAVAQAAIRAADLIRADSSAVPPPSSGDLPHDSDGPNQEPQPRKSADQKETTQRRSSVTAVPAGTRLAHLIRGQAPVTGNFAARTCW